MAEQPRRAESPDPSSPRWMSAVIGGFFGGFLPFAIVGTHRSMSMSTWLLVAACTAAGAFAGWNRTGAQETMRQRGAGVGDIEIPTWAGLTYLGLAIAWFFVVYLMFTDRVDSSGPASVWLIGLPIAAVGLTVILILEGAYTTKQPGDAEPRVDRRSALNTVVSMVTFVLIAAGGVSLSANDAAWVVFGLVCVALVALIFLTIRKQRRISG